MKHLSSMMDKAMHSDCPEKLKMVEKMKKMKMVWLKNKKLKMIENIKK